MKKEKIIFGFIIGVCIVLSFGLAAYAYYQTKAPKRTISVVGLAEEDFTSDLIVWKFSYSTENMDLQKAYSVIKETSKIVKKYLKEQGVSEKELVFEAVVNDKIYNSKYNDKGNYTGSVFKAYQLTQGVRISSKEVNKIEEISRKITDLLDSNINIDSDMPEYYYTKLADLKIKMLAAASDDAQVRALTIAEHSGAKLGKLETATMGVFQITAPNSDEDYTWGGSFNTSSKEKRASINMRLTYNLE